MTTSSYSFLVCVDSDEKWAVSAIQHWLYMRRELSCCFQDVLFDFHLFMMRLGKDILNLSHLHFLNFLDVWPVFHHIWKSYSYFFKWFYFLSLLFFWNFYFFCVSPVQSVLLFPQILFIFRYSFNFLFVRLNDLNLFFYKFTNSFIFLLRSQEFFISVSVPFSFSTSIVSLL